jgi:2'-5' RNA ligase
MKDNLYFIALLTPDDLSAEITAFKQHIADNFNSRKALRIMPHITIIPPFKLKKEEHGNLTGWFLNLPVASSPFTIQLNGFGSFDNSRHPVIYVKPEENTALRLLQQEVSNAFKAHYPEMQLQKHFNPHMTIAYRDLTREDYEKAWLYYKDKAYAAGFAVNEVWLLQHNGKQWIPITRKQLNSTN